MNNDLWFVSINTLLAETCACKASAFPSGVSVKLCDTHAKAFEAQEAIAAALQFLGNTTDPSDAAFAVCEQLRSAKS